MHPPRLSQIGYGPFGSCSLLFLAFYFSVTADDSTPRNATSPSREHTFSPRELARVVGVSESSMKRWIDAGEVEAVRTAGGHRRVSRREAVRFIRERGLPIADVAALDLPGLAAIASDGMAAGTTPEAIVEALRAGEAARARALILTEYIRGTPVPELCDGLVKETLYLVGRLWKQNGSTVGIGIEHEATDLFIQALGQIRSLRRLPSADASVAVGGAIAGDPYIIPSLMAATVLEDLGFDVTNLGPDTPVEVLAETALRREASLVWLSVSTVASLDVLRRADATLVSELNASGTHVIVGGREASEEALAGATALGSMQELANVGKRILAARLNA